MFVTRFRAWAIAIACACPVRAAGQDPIFSVARLHQYVAQVLESNAGYAAAQSRVAAAGERIGPAGALPDPIARLGLIAAPVPSFDLAAEGMTRVPIGISQTFPFPGKQAALSNLARADSGLAQETLGATESRLATRAAELYFDYLFALAAVAVWRSRIDLADQAIATARVRYQTGTAPQIDLLRAELKRARLDEQGLLLRSDVTGVRAHINALRGGRTDSLPIPDSLTPALLPTERLALDSALFDSLFAQLANSNPRLLVAAARIEQRRRTAIVFDMAARPDFTIAIENGLRFGGRQPFLTALVGVSIPLWSGRKQSPAARAAHFDLAAARHDYAELADHLGGLLRDQLSAIASLQQRVHQTSVQILPLAVATTASALERYAVGDVELTALLETQDDLFETRLELARLVAEYGAARANLASLIGEEWYR